MKNRALDGMSRALFDSDLIASRLALFLAERQQKQPVQVDDADIIKAT